MKLHLEIDLGDLINALGLGAVNKLQALLTLDTTGSMYSILSAARRHQCSLIDTVFTRPNTEIGFIGHGDYEDELDAKSYATRGLPFTTDKRLAKKFIKELPPTYGYCFSECYERVMAEGLEYPWQEDASKLLVLFGDATPHDASFRLNVNNYDWRKLAREYKKRGIQVVAVQCLNRPEATSFYKEFARLAGGVHVHLNRFEDLQAAVLASIARSTDSNLLSEVEAQVGAQLGGRLSYDLQDIFASLSGRNKVERDIDSELELVDPARFQEYVVSTEEEQSLREFVAEHNLGTEFDNGKGGFKTGLIYNCVDAALKGKSELRANHEVVLHPLGEDWEVWKQSTSSNRKMKPDTRVLVDLKDAA